MTDWQGRWSLPFRQGAHVFVVKPSDWSLPTGRAEQPWFVRMGPNTPLADTDFVLDFNSEPRSFDVALVADTQPESELELTYVRETVMRAVARSKARFAINHGDIAFDNSELYGAYQAMTAETNIAWHNCPGNHDFDGRETGALDRFETWRQLFGPTHYALRYGGATFIILNNVQALPAGKLTKGGFGYRGQVGADQLEFVRALLQHLALNELVVVSMHIPLVGLESPLEESGRTSDCEELLGLLSGRPHTVSFSGHTHTTEHHYLGAEHGFLGPGRHHHHVLTAACGSWWSGPLDRINVPTAESRDGTPKGFHILSIDGARYTTLFVPTGYEGHSRIRMAVAGASLRPMQIDSSDRTFCVWPGSLSQAPDMAPSLYVNVFDGGPRTRVSVAFCPLSEENIASERTVCELRRELVCDPLTVRGYEASKTLLKPWVEASLSSHIWHGPLPQDLMPGRYRVSVEVSDEYGRAFSVGSTLELLG